MPTDHRAVLAGIKTFRQLLAYLRDMMGWPIDRIEIDELMFDYTADELGIDARNSAKILEIKRLRPLSAQQPWGIFFVKFEPKKLPVVALRRILSQVALKKRASANSAIRTAWAADDLLFISNYGEGDERTITFAHFSRDGNKQDLPVLKVLGWNDGDTALHLDGVASQLTSKLGWPPDERDVQAWRDQWGSAFTLRHGEVIATSKDLSIRLAALARTIRERARRALAIETERGPLTKLMTAFKEALLHDLDADGFADMYAQTIAYGLLCARIADPAKKTADDFAGHMRTNPLLRELMQAFVAVGGRRDGADGHGIDFDELGVNEVVELLDYANMEAVVRDFGDKNPQEDPVTHFYEGFAKEYDPIDKVKRGEFYTPRPVVSYIIRSVDELLRAEFGLEDGLADNATWGEMAERHNDLKIPPGIAASAGFVQILDPATGTGTFLVEVVDVIHKTMIAKWKAQGIYDKEIDVLWNEYVPTRLLPRLHAYELKMAPYAIAHLKIGLKLHETGYRFGSEERAHIYLTNGLEPASDAGQMSLEGLLPALAHEAQAVNQIKQKQRFTVVVGNPPYAGVSANRGEWITALIDRYRFVAGEPLAEKKVWLKNDYVKFIRLSQLAIELSGVGIVGLITDHSYLDSPTFRGLRHNLLQTFPRARLFNLHGNSKRRETAPDGQPDENVFEITQGTAIALLARGPDSSKRVWYADAWGTRSQKYYVLTNSSVKSTAWRESSPHAGFYLFVPQNAEVSEAYRNWWLISDVLPLGSNGVQTSRDALVLAPSRKQLLDRFAWIRDKSVPDADIRSAFQVEDKSFWRLSDARLVLRKDQDWTARIVSYAYRPFDNCWLYASPAFVHRLRREVMQHMEHPNVALCVGRAGLVVEGMWDLVFVTKSICDHNLFYRGSSLNSPLLLHDSSNELTGMRGRGGSGQAHNIGHRFIAELARVLDLPLSRERILPSGLEPRDIFNYAYAVLSSPEYRMRYAEFLNFDFPRLPIPASLDLFRDLARLGDELVALHLMESPKLDNVITNYTGANHSEIGRVGWSDGVVWLDTAATKKGQSVMPGTIGFHGVPEAVWNFHIGGYQVCEKWLKDRKGRRLSEEDIAHYQKIVVALAETILLMQEIDAVIERHGGWPGAFDAACGNA